MTGEVSARVFVVGCPRSGTTVAQSLIGAHPLVRAFPESHFFARAADAPREEAMTHLRRFLDAAGVAVPAADGDVSPVEAFVAALDAATLADGAEAWSEKTPRHLHHVDRIARDVPRSRFVHVLRRGVEVARSLERVTREQPEQWGGRPRSLRRCARRWELDVKTSLEYLGRPEHLLVRYESLVARPEAVAAELCRFLGLDEDPAMVERRAGVARAVTLPEETWKAPAAGPLAAPPPVPVSPDLAGAVAETQDVLDRLVPVLA